MSAHRLALGRIGIAATALGAAASSRGGGWHHQHRRGIGSSAQQRLGILAKSIGGGSGAARIGLSAAAAALRRGIAGARGAAHRRIVALIGARRHGSEASSAKAKSIGGRGGGVKMSAALNENSSAAANRVIGVMHVRRVGSINGGGVWRRGGMTLGVNKAWRHRHHHQRHIIMAARKCGIGGAQSAAAWRRKKAARRRRIALGWLAAAA